jgi:DNA-binding transcriptional LysR family regulator
MDRLSALGLFIRVVEGGSFTRAAEGAGLAQPTVSRQIAGLEQELGVRLLERSTRSVRATGAGLDLYERAKRLLDEAQAIEADLRQGARSAAGRIRVACPMTFGRMYVVPVVVRFLKENAGAEVDLLMNDRFVDLVEEGVDVAIRIADLTESPLYARLLGASPRVLVATDAYLRGAGTLKRPEDLERHNVAVYSYLHNPETLVLSGRRGQVEVRVRGNFRVNSADALREAVLADLGIAMLPLWSVVQELQRNALRIVLPGWKPPANQVYAVFASNRFLPMRVRMFIDYLKGRLQLPVG